MAELNDQVSVASGTAPRLPVVLVMDTSWSVQESGLIADVNDALRGWPDQVRANARVRRHAEFAMVTFGDGVKVAPLAPSHTPGRDARHAFIDAPDVEPEPLVADGVSRIAEALELALDLCEDRITALTDENLQVYVPNVWLLTDGEPTDAAGDPSDDWQAIVPRLRAMEERNHALFFAVGLPGARSDVLAELAPDSHYDFGEVSFADALALITLTSGELAKADGGTVRQRYCLVRALIDELNEDSEAA
jgi:uncharacterized protein YegL